MQSPVSHGQQCTTKPVQPCSACPVQQKLNLQKQNAEFPTKLSVTTKLQQANKTFWHTSWQRWIDWSFSSGDCVHCSGDCVLMIVSTVLVTVSWWLCPLFWWLCPLFWWLRLLFWWLCPLFWWLCLLFWWLCPMFWWLYLLFWWLCPLFWWLCPGDRVHCSGDWV